MEEGQQVRLCEWCLGSATPVYDLAGRYPCLQCLVADQEATKEVRDHLTNTFGVDVSDFGPHELAYIGSNPIQEQGSIVEQMGSFAPRMCGPDHREIAIEDEDLFVEQISRGNVHTLKMLTTYTLMMRSTFIAIRHAKSSTTSPTTDLSLLKNETMCRAFGRALDIVRQASPGLVELAQAEIRSLEENTL